MIATAGDTSGRLRRRNMILKLREKGLTLSEISKKLGITNGTTGYYLKNYSQVTKEGFKGPKVKRMSPIVLGSDVNGSGNNSTINDASLLDLLWARLTVEEKVQAIKGIKEADNG